MVADDKCAGRDQLVVRVWGQDTKGIAGAFMNSVVAHNAKILDLSQFLLGNSLTFTFILGVGQDCNTVAMMSDLTKVANDFNLQCDFHASDGKAAQCNENNPNVAVMYVVSANAFSPKLVYQLDQSLSHHGCAILNIENRSDNKKESNGDFNKLAITFACPAGFQLSALRCDADDIMKVAQNYGADITIRWWDAMNRPNGKSLIVFGLSQVLYKTDVLDEVLKEQGLDPKVAVKADDDNPEEEAKRKVAMLKGADSKVVQQVIDRLDFTPGAALVTSALKKMGFRMAVLTNTGMRDVAEHVKKQLGIDYVICRDLTVDDNGKFTGEYCDETPDVAFRKADLLKLMADREGIEYRNVIVVGDALRGLKPASQRLVMETFGPMVYFNAEKMPDLSIALYLLGFNGADVQALRNNLKRKWRQGPGADEAKLERRGSVEDNLQNHFLITVSSMSCQPGQLSRILESIQKHEASDLHIVTLRQCSLQHGGMCLGIDFYGNTNEIAQGIGKEILYSCQKHGFQIHEVGEKSSLNCGRACWSHYLHKRHVITLVQQPVISGDSMVAVMRCLSENNINILKMTRLSLEEMAALQFTVDLPEACVPDEISSKLVALSKAHGADVAFQKDDLFRWMRRLVIFDMDSTLIEGEVIDELAKLAGVEDKVSAITKAAMRGEINFFESLKQRVALLKGHNAEELFAKVRAELVYSPGAEKLCRVLKRLGYKMAVISGGFIPMAQVVQRHLGLDYAFANNLEVDEKGILTGRTTGPVVTPQRKRALLATIANVEGCDVKQTIAVGDGANDIPMLSTAGLGIAFCAKPKVQEVAEFRINQKDLSTICFLIGVSEPAAQRLINDHA